MSRYIDADKLLELFEQDDDVFKSQDIRHIIETLMKDDKYDFLRCNNCMYWDDTWCKLHDGIFECDGYCSYGVRRVK